MGFKEKIELKLGDITLMEVDAIVNAANNDLILGGGVSGAIRRSAGPSVQEECNRIGTIPIGQAVITGPGLLKSKYIVHAASMSLGSWTTTHSLRDSVKNALLRAEEKEIKTIAFPAIGTGTAGFSVEKCAMIMFEIFAEHFKKPSGIEKVFLVLFNEKTHLIFQEYYNNIDRPPEPPAPPMQVAPPAQVAPPTAPAPSTPPATSTPSTPPAAPAPVIQTP